MDALVPHTIGRVPGFAASPAVDPLAARPAASLYELLAAQAQRDPDAVAILAPQRAPLSFGALLDQVDYIRTTLNGCGLGRGDRIALIGARGCDMAAAALGIVSSAVCMPLNAATQPAELEQVLRQAPANALFVPTTASVAIKELAAGLEIPLFECSVPDGAPAGQFHIDGARPAAVAAKDRPANLADLAYMMRTSGTTARAKIALTSHGNIVARAGRARRMMGLTPADRCLNLMPLCYSHGSSSGLMWPLAAGCAVICPPAFNREMFFDCMRDFSPTWFTASFTYHEAILEWLGQEPNALAGHRLRFVRAGSGPLSGRVAVALEKIVGAPVLEIYGSTETGTISASSPDRLRKPGMVGRPLGDEVAIMAADGQILPSGIEGEVVVRGAAVCRGYENNPAANERAFCGEWYRTGDQGVIDADGYLKLLGRLDEMINRGGEKIAPQQVDEVLLAHPAVAEALCFPVPHARLHQDIAAAVVPRRGAQVTEAELRRFLAARLAPFKVPRVILCVAELPKGPTGKFVRADMAAYFGVGRDAVPSQVQAPTKYHEILLALWREVLKRQDIGVDDDFFRLGGDSLSAMDLLCRIEEELQYRIPITLLVEAPTVSRFAVSIEVATLGAKNSTIRIHTDGTQRPLFAVYGRWGHVVRLLPLLRSLGPDQPCYGLQPPAMDWSNVSCTTLPEMAAHYVGEVKAVQPHGPYRLLGFSFGGLIVFEMALQLQRLGDEVEFLGIMDANPPTNLSVGGVDPTGANWDHAERRDSINQRLAETQLRARLDYVLDSRLEQNIFRGELTLFYCIGNPIVAGHDRRRLWQRFAPRFRLISLPGLHSSVDREPQFSALLNLLRACNAGTAPAGSDPAAVFDREYRIERRDRGECIVGSAGELYCIEKDNDQGYVDAIRIDAKTIEIKGWAVEPGQRQAAQTIAVFLGSRLLGYGASGLATPETAQRLAAPLAAYAGFEFAFSRKIAPDVTGRPRLFVLSDGDRAAELRFSVEHDLAKLQTELAQSLGENAEMRTKLAQSLGESEAIRANLAQSLGESEEMRAKLAHSLNENAEMRAALAQSLDENAEMRAKLAQSLTDTEEKRAELLKLRARSDGLRSECAALTIQVEERTIQVEELRSSTSWRITAPLRHIRRRMARSSDR